MDRLYRVVVVDDDTDDLQILGFSLKEPSVLDGRQLQVVLFEKPQVLSDQNFEPIPDVLILDYRFPFTTALSLIKHLRANPAYDRSKILVWSANASDQEIADTLQAGADWYMPKPFTYGEIKKKMKYILDKWCLS